MDRLAGSLPSAGDPVFVWEQVIETTPTVEVGVSKSHLRWRNYAYYAQLAWASHRSKRHL